MKGDGPVLESYHSLPFLVACGTGSSFAYQPLSSMEISHFSDLIRDVLRVAERKWRKYHPSSMLGIRSYPRQIPMGYGSIQLIDS